MQTEHTCVGCREKAALAEEVLQKAVQLKELKANSSVSQEASDISEQVHNCCHQKVLLADLSEDLSACCPKLCPLTQTLPAILIFACSLPKSASHPKVCLLTQTLPAIPNFACYPKLCLLSPKLCLLSQSLRQKLCSLTRQSDV